MREMKNFIKYAVVVFAVFGVVGAVRSAEPVKPLRVAVYVDNGARGEGAFRWIQIATIAENVESKFIDGEAVRSGALDNVDLLIMPGGSSQRISSSLGEVGHEKIKSFIRSGGGYLGTCAGCCLLMQSDDKKHKNMMNVIPYTFGVCGGKSDVDIEFNDKASELAGIPEGDWSIRYSQGPVPVETTTKEKDLNTLVVARYGKSIKAMGEEPWVQFPGSPAAFACTYGKGKIFAFTVHPEMDFNDHDLIKRAIRYVTGREIEWCEQKPLAFQRTVGVVCDFSFGVDTANFVQSMLKSREFFVVPLVGHLVAKGALDKVDAVLAPHNVAPDMAKKGLYGDNLKLAEKFIERGGRVFAWGRSIETAKFHSLKVESACDAGSAIEMMRNFLSAPKSTDPIGVFDSGIGGMTVLDKMLTMDLYDNSTHERRSDGRPDFEKENFVYFGDQANMPYGDYAAYGKSDYLKSLILSDADFLLKNHAKSVVIACNTATAWGLKEVSAETAMTGVDTVGVIGAGVLSALSLPEIRNAEGAISVGVMATPGTIASGAYERTIAAEVKRLGIKAKVTVITQGCAGLADAVEAGDVKAGDIAVENYRALSVKHEALKDAGPLEAVILGCTHYPFVLTPLKKEAPAMDFVDPALATAEACYLNLLKKKMLSEKGSMDLKAYISVPSPLLDKRYLDANGNLTREIKYSRSVWSSVGKIWTVVKPYGEAEAKANKFIRQSLNAVWKALCDD